MSPLREACDAALVSFQSLNAKNARAAVVVCNTFLQGSASKISIEHFGNVPILQFAVGPDITGIARGGFVAACAQCGMGTTCILAEGCYLDDTLPNDCISAVTDHINLMGDSPLIGLHDPSLGPRFPDMSEPFSRALLEMIEGLTVHRRCVYASLLSDETMNLDRREQLVQIGVNVLGPWIGPELLCARQRSMKVLAFAAPSGAHYGAVRSMASGSYYSQFKEIVAGVMTQLCP